MKKNLLLLCLFTAAFLHLTPQTNINLTFTAEINGIRQSLDSILIENLTQGGDTTLYKPDTVLVLEYSVGIEDRVSMHDNQGILFSAYPNPVSYTSTIELQLLQDAPVTLRLYDMSGRELITFSKSLIAGNHNFLFSPGKRLIYFLIAEIEGQRMSQKIVSTNSGQNSCRLIYAGHEPVTANMRKGGSLFPWAPGNDLMFIGFTADRIDSIYDTPLLSSFYTFQYSLYPPGTVHCDPSNPTEVVEVVNPLTGKIWMDRNLGASRVATGSTDSLAYGDLYQWGRFSDGHQCRTSNTTSTQNSLNVPGHGDFIMPPNFPYDWRYPQNPFLWQGSSGVNNPCPFGYRVPTRAELNYERLSWSSNDAAGAIDSPLKLPMAGVRFSINGSIANAGTAGLYWSRTFYEYDSRYLFFNTTNAFMNYHYRAYGRSVRCIMH